MNFLLMGSGQQSNQVPKWNTKGWTIGAIHNAWSIIPDRVDYFFVSGDFIPAPYNKPPKEFKSRVRVVTYDEYDGPSQRERFGRQRFGIGATMLFNAAYWILGELQPEVLGFVGCSMDYPQGQPNTFYKGGKADPLRFGEDKLKSWFKHFQRFAQEYRCELVNFGSGLGYMPYPCRRFSVD